MFWNRTEFLTQTFRPTTAIGRWVVVYLLASYLYFSLTYDLVESIPALLIPSLMPLSVLSACVSWQIEKEIEPAHVKTSANASKSSILPLLCMSVFYSSVVEGFLFEWFLHGGLRPWLRIGVDLFCLSPFFTDGAATYVYQRLLGENHDWATNYLSIRLPSFALPLLGLWSVFSIIGNEVLNPILSFMIFDFGIVVWTIFFTWANRVDLPERLRTSPHQFLRRLGALNDVLSRPLARFYSWKLFGSYLRDLVILVFALAIGSELWLVNIIASPNTLATIMAIGFTVWKGWEFLTENRPLPDSIDVALLPVEDAAGQTFPPNSDRQLKLKSRGAARLIDDCPGSHP